VFVVRVRAHELNLGKKVGTDLDLADEGFSKLVMTFSWRGLVLDGGSVFF